MFKLAALIGDCDLKHSNYWLGRRAKKEFHIYLSSLATSQGAFKNKDSFLDIKDEPEITGKGKRELQFSPATRANELGWKKLLFVPYKLYWCICIIFVTQLCLHVDVYRIEFTQEAISQYDMFSLLLILVALEVLCMTILKLWESVSSSQEYKTPGWGYLICGGIVAIPLKGLISSLFLLYDVEELSVFYRIVIILHGLLRAVWGLTSFIPMLRSTLCSKLHISTLLTCITAEIVVVVAVVLLFELSREKNSYLNHLGSSNLDSDNPVHACLASYILAVEHILHGDLSGIQPHTNNEFVICGLLLYVGAIGFDFIYFGYVLNRAHIALELFFSHRRVSKQIDTRLVANKMSNDLRNKVKEYYFRFWNEWRLIPSTKVLNHLSNHIRMLVLLDMGWDAIQHNKLIEHASMNFKREISGRLERLFFLPDDYIFSKGILKHFIGYLVSGNVEVLSDDAYLSPLMKLSSGSILGGVAAVLPSENQMAVRCETFCELITISAKDLAQALLKYPWETRYTLYIMFEHLSFALAMKQMSSKLHIHNRLYKLYGIKKGYTVKWIKTRWEQIASFSDVNESKDGLMDIVYSLKMDPYRTSRFLSSIVLTRSGSAANEGEKFCFSSQYPFIINPHSSFTYVWDLFTAGLILFSITLVPYYACFHIVFPPFIQRLIIVQALIYLLDIYLLLITAVVRVDDVINQPMSIVRYRLRTFNFYVEMVSGLPIGLVIWVTHLHDPLSSYAELLRLIKFHRLRRVLYDFEFNVETDGRLFRFVKQFLEFYIVIHWCACLIYIYSCFFGECAVDTIFDSLAKAEQATSVGNEPFDRYVICFQFSVCMFTTTTPLPADPIRWEDIVLFAIIVLTCKLYVLYGIARMVAGNVQEVAQTVALTRTLSKCKKFIKDYDKKNLRVVNQYLKRLGEINNCIDFMDDSDYWNTLSWNLRNRIYLEMENQISQVPFFAVGTLQYKTFFQKIVGSGRVYKVPKETELLRQGEYPESLNIICKGYCQVTSILENNKDLNTVVPLSNGLCIGLLEMIYQLRGLASVTTCTDCELISIPCNAFNELLSNLPELKQEIEDMHKFNRKPVKLYKEMVNRLSVSAAHLTKSQESIPAKLSYRQKIIKALDHFRAFARGEITIRPDGTFMRMYEIYRCVLFLMSACFFVSLVTTVIPSIGRYFLIYAVFFDFMSLLDIIFKFRVSFYNRAGLLVTCPRAIATHYIHTSFMVDVISTLPIYLSIGFRSTGKQFDVVCFYLITLKSLPLYRVVGLYLYHSQRSFVTYAVIYLSVAMYSLCVMCAVRIHLICELAILRSFADVGYLDCIDSVTLTCPTMITCNLPADQITPFVSWMITVLYFLTSFTGVHTKGQVFLLTRNDFLISSLVLLAGYAYRVGFRTLTIQHIVTKISYLDSFMPMSDEALRVINRAYQLAYARVKVMDKCLRHIYHLNLYQKIPAFAETVTKFHPAIQTRVLGKFIKTVLLQSPILKRADSWFIHKLSNLVKIETCACLTTLVEIGRTNDKLYLLSKGWVQVEQPFIFSQKQLILGPGSLFGCFSRVGSVRQRLRFTCYTNTIVLTMKSSSFIKLVESYPKIKRRLEGSTFPFHEYVPGFHTRQGNVKPDFKEAFYFQPNLVIRVMDFLLSFVVPFFTLVLLSMLIPLDKTFIHNGLIALDVIALGRVPLQLVNPIFSGSAAAVITNRRILRQNYFWSLFGLTLDICSLFPLNYIYTSRWLWFNRLLRGIILYRYSKRLHKGTLMRYTIHNLKNVSICWMLIILFLAGIFSFLDLGDYIVSATDNYVRSFYLSSALVTGVSFKNDKLIPKNTWIIALFISTLLISIILLSHYMGVSGKTLMVANYFSILFDKRISCMHHYLARQNVSAILQQLATKHCESLRDDNAFSGDSMLSYSIPVVILQDIMFEIYKSVLKSHALFKDCHSKFTFQIISHFTRILAYPGEEIVVSGAVDNCMYFVFFGEVDVWHKSGMQETMVDCLTTGDSFGLLQGLYHPVPHFYSYQAKTSCEILSLSRDAWTELIAFYPMDALLIYRRAQYCLRMKGLE